MRVPVEPTHLLQQETAEAGGRTRIRLGVRRLDLLPTAHAESLRHLYEANVREKLRKHFWAVVMRTTMHGLRAVANPFCPDARFCRKSPRGVRRLEGRAGDRRYRQLVSNCSSISAV